MTDEQRRAKPPVDHPIVRTHPETGRKCIYLGDHAEYIVGMPYAEGRALIEELNTLAVHPDLTYEHHWKPGELIVWDNRCLMHRATAVRSCDARAGRCAAAPCWAKSRYRAPAHSRAGQQPREPMNEKTVKPASIAAQALGWVDDTTRAIAPPIHTSTTFIRDADNQYRSGRIYARDHNPTFDQAEAVLTALEGGHASLLFASGMAAATAVFLALAPGDHVLAPKVMYWSLRNWLMNFATQWGLRVEFIDMTDIDALRARAAARAHATRLDRNAGQSAVDDHRHRRQPARSRTPRAPRWPSTRPPRRRC